MSAHAFKIIIFAYKCFLKSIISVKRIMLNEAAPTIPLVPTDLVAKIREQYTIVRKLGDGGQAEVYLGTRILEDGVVEKVALKIPREFCSRNRTVRNRRELLDKEIRILQVIRDKCSHGPGGAVKVVRLIGTIETMYNKAIVLEYFEGRDFFDDIIHERNYGENLARKVIFSIARILRSLQSAKVVHRDLKFENLIYSTNDADRELKLIDFGMACLESDDNAQTGCGTPTYQAPEILAGSQGASSASDVWSLGVMLYVMLSGVYPFGLMDSEQSKREFRDKVLRNEVRVPFPSEYWRHIHLENTATNVKDLIEKMLIVDPQQRISVENILTHPWIVAAPTEQQEQPLGDEVLNRLRCMHAVSVYGSAVWAVIFVRRWLKKTRAAIRRRAAAATAASSSSSSSSAAVAVVPVPEVTDEHSSPEVTDEHSSPEVADEHSSPGYVSKKRRII